MARQAAEKTTRINREPPEHVGIEKYCRGLDTWPRSWMGMEDDMPPGERLIECFRPFIGHLAASGKSRRTIQEHVDNMWALGGEFITELNYDPTLRKRSVDRVLREMIRYGGPHLRHADGEQQASFDTTCEMFRQFLGKTAR
jgi:hypothetical protein